MPKACDVKRGDIVDINGQPYIVKEIDVRSPSSRGANTLYKIRFNNVQTKQKVDQTYTGDDMLKPIDFYRREVQYLYQDGNLYVFMDKEDFSQYSLDQDAIEDQLPYLTDSLEGINGLFVDGNPIGVQLPSTVVLEIVDTPPVMKGATATKTSKPATLNTGLEVQVPEYITVGEKIKVNTETGKYMSRA